jgi:hypothetical protein
MAKISLEVREGSLRVYGKVVGRYASIRMENFKCPSHLALLEASNEKSWTGR